MADFVAAELVTYDPEDIDTYPSVCQAADEVRDRFGLVGGETLIFSKTGAYLGQLINHWGKESNAL